MSWIARRERGSLMLLRLAFWIVRHAGWHAGLVLLYPITLYFYAFSPAERVASRDYLGRVLPHPVRERDVIRHFFTFASVLLDRIFFLSGRTQAYGLEEHGVDELTALLARGEGCVLLGAHLGSFDMLRAFGRKSPVPVNPVMVRGRGGVFSRLIETLDPELARRIIDITEPGAMLAVQECIARGEMVGFLGDRIPGPQRAVELPFLGGTASFPAGPLVLASMLRAPVVLFYGVRTGPRRYAVRFEPFADRIELRRATRNQDVQAWLGLYADSLAASCRAYPFNWFNFYPFWHEPAQPRETGARALAAALAIGLAVAPWGARAGDGLAAAIMARLAALPDRQARFVDDKRLAALEQPQESHGTLIFRHPAHLEKITAPPGAERLVIDGGVLTIAQDGAAPRTLALDSHPALRALAGTITATLAGDLPALQRLYAMTATGSAASWRIALRPRDPALSRFIAAVTLDGAGADLRVLRIAQANGDSETMDITPLPTP
jgi:predicted LPLAT superfamily acyltransferase